MHSAPLPLNVIQSTLSMIIQDNEGDWSCHLSTAIQHKHNLNYYVKLKGSFLFFWFFVNTLNDTSQINCLSHQTGCMDALKNILHMCARARARVCACMRELLLVGSCVLFGRKRVYILKTNRGISRFIGQRRFKIYKVKSFFGRTSNKRFGSCRKEQL